MLKPAMPPRQSPTYQERVNRHAAVAAKLRALSDAELKAALAVARPLFAGIGGTSLLLTVDEHPVFVKRVPLTDREHESSHWQSTANLFHLPAVCHYGIGSPGFGAWRELAAAKVASDWALAGECEHFALLYHWRVLPAPPPDALTEEHWSVLEADTRQHRGLTVVEERIDAMCRASFHLLMFFEYVPTTLLTWTVERLKEGAEAASSAMAFIDQSLWPALEHMHGHRLFHFDAHFENIQTDGSRLYVCDFGLAIGPGFALDEAERKFLERHRSYDRRRVAVALMHSIASVYFPSEPWDRDLRSYMAGKLDLILPAGIDAAIREHGPAAMAFKDIARALPDGRATDFAFGSCPNPNAHRQG